MSSISRQATNVATSLNAAVPVKSCAPRRRKSRRRLFSCYAERTEPGRPNPRYSSSDVKRICTQGPSFEDLKQQHTMSVKEAMKVKQEKIEFVRWESFGDGMYAAEPKWSQLEEISFMKFYKGIEARNWRSEFYDRHAVPWKIQFFEDSGRLFRPIFNGYRALIEEQGKKPVWCNLSNPGVQTYEEDFLMDREFDGLPETKRFITPGYPSDYGYLQVFERLGIAFQERIPVKLQDRYKKVKVMNKKMAQSLNPSRSSELLDISFHCTPQEPSLHNLWYTAPRVGLIAFALSFLGICLMIGIFKPRKQMPADPTQAMEFAQSKGRARKDGRTGVRFSDIAGLDNILNDLKELVEFLKEPSKYQGVHAKPPKGVLLEGPPGTGKTLIAKAVAGEAGVPFYQMSGSEFVEAIVGVGAARVRDLFKRARAQEEACIIFVDEIDALGTKRAEAGMITNEEREQTLNQLLTEMDGFSSELGVVFVAATNRADLLDPALQRPGRFDRKLRVVGPDTDGRYQILSIHAKKHKLAKDVDLMQLARDLPGLAGAELANVLNESALEAIRQDGDEITTKDIYNAVDRVLQGIRHPVQPVELKIGRMFAVHEMGRAIVATVLRERTHKLEAVEKLSIIARGREKTRTVFFRGEDEDYTMTTRSRMLERISVILAGRAAEEFVLGDPTTYGSKDLGPAFRLAEKIVTNYSLSELGITSCAPANASSAIESHSFEVHVDNIDEDLFGRGLQGGMFQASDTSLHKILTKCYEIMWTAYKNSLDILAQYSNALEAGSNRLLEKQELTGEEVVQLIKMYPPKPLQTPVTSETYKVCAQQHPSPLSLREDAEYYVTAKGESEPVRPEEREAGEPVCFT